MATSANTSMAAEQSLPRRRPIERPLGFEGFWARYGNAIFLVINVSLFFVIWEAVARAGVVSKLLLPRFSDVMREFILLVKSGQFGLHMRFTLTSLSLGFLIAAAAGIPIGLMLGASKLMERILGPYMWALFSTPRLALLPLITVAMGFGLASKVLLVFLAAFFVIAIDTWAGVKMVDASLVRAGRVFGANRFQIFTKIVVPYTLPFIVNGLRVGVTRAIITALVAEMLASSRGLGFLVIRSMDSFNTGRMYSLILVLVFLSLAIVSALRWLEAHIAPWRESTNI